MTWTGIRRAELPPTHIWQRIRRAVFTRDHWTCIDCGHRDPTGRTLEADHIGDRHNHSLDNLATRCGPRANDCHGRLTRSHRRARPIELHPGVIR